MNRAEQWREKSRKAAAEEAIELPLPSGMVIMARRPGAGLLVGWGLLPMHLAGHVTGGQDGDRAAEQDSQTAAFAKTVREILEYCVVEPRISLTPAADEIHPRDISDPDLRFILAWAMRREEAARLESFRRQPTDGSTDSGGASVERTTVADAGPGRSGARAGAGSGRNLRMVPIEE